MALGISIAKAWRLWRGRHHGINMAARNHQRSSIMAASA